MNGDTPEIPFYEDEMTTMARLYGLERMAQMMKEAMPTTFKTHMTIKELIRTAHSAAKEKGFWDQERDMAALLMLIVSECGEALEADRSQKRADIPRYELTAMAFPEASFRDCIKDTFEDELADIVIRIADLCGGLNIEPMSLQIPLPKDVNIGAALFGITGALVKSIGDKAETLDSPDPLWIGSAMGMVFSLAESQDIDLWRHIELKLAYNKTRAQMHGKTY